VTPVARHCRLVLPPDEAIKSNPIGRRRSRFGSFVTRFTLTGVLSHTGSNFLGCTGEIGGEILRAVGANGVHALGHSASFRILFAYSAVVDFVTVRASTFNANQQL
jgi:hypothetical protein